MSETLSGLGAFAVVEDGSFHNDLVSFWMISSAIVFQALHEVHCPCHLENCAPQFWQKKAVFSLDKVCELN
jgi:hypothetical protein